MALVHGPSARQPPSKNPSSLHPQMPVTHVLCDPLRASPRLLVSNLGRQLHKLSKTHQGDSRQARRYGCFTSAQSAVKCRQASACSVCIP